MTPPDDMRRALLEGQALGLFRLLHKHARNGYEPGDCHCDACGMIVDDLCEFFGITPADAGGGIFDPAARVRAAAAERGWT